MFGNNSMNPNNQLGNSAGGLLASSNPFGGNSFGGNTLMNATSLPGGGSSSSSSPMGGTAGGGSPSLGPFDRLLGLPGIDGPEDIFGRGSMGGSPMGGGSTSGGSGNPFTGFGNPNAAGSPILGGTNPWSAIPSQFGMGGSSNPFAGGGVTPQSGGSNAQSSGGSNTSSEFSTNLTNYIRNYIANGGSFSNLPGIVSNAVMSNMGDSSTQQSSSDGSVASNPFAGDSNPLASGNNSFANGMGMPSQTPEEVSNFIRDGISRFANLTSEFMSNNPFVNGSDAFANASNPFSGSSNPFQLPEDVVNYIQANMTASNGTAN